MASTASVRSEFRSDEEIQREVLAELKWDARVQPNEIGVIVKDGVVTLTGWVDSYFKKWAAEEAAHRVRGVMAVANDIEVRLSIDKERTDADIAAAAIHALEWDALIPPGKINVTVSKGWVTLKGEVEWQFQKEDAERAGKRAQTRRIACRFEHPLGGQAHAFEARCRRVGARDGLVRQQRV